MKNDEKKISELEVKCQAQLEKVSKIADDNDPRRVRAKFISCKKCESKLAKDFIKRTGYFCKCPVCGESLYSKTAQERMKSAREKYQSMKAELDKLKDTYKKQTQPTFAESLNRAYDMLEIVYNRHDEPDFTELHGNTGGDPRCIRVYKNGMICEK